MYAIVDIETTGGKPSQNRMIEIGVVIFDGDRILNEFSSLVNPFRPIDDFVSKLTGITDDMVKDAPPFADIVEVLQKVFEGSVLVGHNVAFDYSIIKKEFKRLGLPFKMDQICTLQLSKIVAPKLKSHKLVDVCHALNIQFVQSHRALSDAVATTLLLQKLLESLGENKLKKLAK